MAALATPVSLGAFPKSALGARRAGARRSRVSPRVRAAVETAPAADPLEDVKVGAAKLAIKLLPGEGGLKAIAGVLPSKYKNTFLGLIDSYKTQMLKATNGDEARASTALTSIFKDMMTAYAGQIIGTPYEFPSHHICIREPFDYYQMANAYIGSLVEFDRSILRYPERWTAIQQALDRGENVVLMGNHQSEGDAAFIPLLTEVSHPGLGESITYVAGDRVVTDLLCKPFSMGKNLLCVHSKKHMDDDPALKSAKMKQNLNTVKAMQRLLKQGGICIWIAPAGGRDRRSPDGTITPDKFDPAAIEMLRKLGTKKGAAKTHYYPLAMATYDIMPPPVAKEKSIGEERIVNFTGAGLSLGEELDVDPATAEWAQGLPEDADLTQALADHLWEKVNEEYKAIEACNVPGGGAVPLPEGAIRPVRPPSVPTF